MNNCRDPAVNETGNILFVSFPSILFCAVNKKFKSPKRKSWKRVCIGCVTEVTVAKQAFPMNGRNEICWFLTTKIYYYLWMGGGGSFFDIKGWISAISSLCQPLAESCHFFDLMFYQVKKRYFYPEMKLYVCYLCISDNDNDDVDLCDKTFSDSCSKSLSSVADLRPLTDNWSCPWWMLSKAEKDKTCLNFAKYWEF